MNAATRLDIYLIAIGGTGMAPLACLLDEIGHNVRGADLPLYPPMKTLLEEAEIVPLVGFDPAHLDPAADAVRPDLVIVGNAVPRHNPEAEIAERLGLPRLSMPEALWRFFLAERRPLVCAGTHGKTTTTALASWVYLRSGRDPGFLIGGLPKNFERSFRVGAGERFVVEGDEYNAAYFDRGPKFLHYRPQTLILNSVEYDHADLYPSHQILLDAYRKLVEMVPADGLLVAFGDSGQLREVAAGARCEVLYFGFGEENAIRPVGLELGESGSRFAVADEEAGLVRLELPIPGRHNVLNALAVYAAARRDGLAPAEIAAAFAEFAGVRRRLDLLGESGGIAVVDDFAHHPTAVGMSLGGLRQRHPGSRIVALFEPRSLTAGRSFFFEPYLEAFRQADLVIFAPVFYRERLGEEQALDVGGLRRGLEEGGVACFAEASNEAVLARALAEARPGDVVVTMSSGSFDGMPHRVLAALRERAGET
jgi:UDP-N-acetylmuramate: L-alanyl-gamma-D-glutamyl-meso-diaminopimelate ligase